MNTVHFINTKRVEISWSPTHKENGVRCRTGSIGKKRVAVVHEKGGRWYGTVTVTREHRILEHGHPTAERCMTVAGDEAALDFLEWKDARKASRDLARATSQPAILEVAE